MTKLRVLNVGSNEMKDIPGSIGYLPELTSLVVEGNPIRRKRLDQPDCKSMLVYLRTKGEPHPLLVDQVASPADVVVGKKVKEAAHYGTLELVGDPKRKPAECLVAFPNEVFDAALADKLTELTVSNHPGLTALPTGRLGSLKKLVALDLSKNR